MYKHILLATDGSDLAQHAVDHGLQLAKSVGARATIITVTMPWSAVAYGDMAVAVPPDDFDKSMVEVATKTLSAAAASAKQKNVPCETMHVSDLNPYQAILKAAEDGGCDLIVVGSHGRSGISRLLLGSETVKILTHSKTPVLVWRE
ncbi:MAG: universal stress protein [Hyphomicrobiaceae bacterium]